MTGAGSLSSSPQPVTARPVRTLALWGARRSPRRRGRPRPWLGRRGRPSPPSIAAQKAGSRYYTGQNDLGAVSALDQNRLSQLSTSVHRQSRNKARRMPLSEHESTHVTLLVTACTLRKRAEPSSELRARQLNDGSVVEVRNDWLARISAASATAPAWRMYCGRGFQEAVLAAQAIGISPTIISAGLGVVDGEQLIPSYSLTITSGSIDDVTLKCQPRVAPEQWWQTLTAGRRSLRDRLGSEKGLIIIALPRSYLSMLREELGSLPASALSRLRVISGSDVSGLSDAIAAAQMPYDDRFDGSDSPNPGTRADFASRAAHHFVVSVLADRPKGSAEQHRADVELALADSAPVERPARTRATDEEIATLLRRHWKAAQGQTARLLRILRDDLGIACEQGRLSRLAQAVRRERGQG